MCIFYTLGEQRLPDRFSELRWAAYSHTLSHYISIPVHKLPAPFIFTHRTRKYGYIRVRSQQPVFFTNHFTTPQKQIRHGSPRKINTP